MFLNADGRLTETGQISRCPAGCSRWWVQRRWKSVAVTPICMFVVAVYLDQWQWAKVVGLIGIVVVLCLWKTWTVRRYPHLHTTSSTVRRLAVSMRRGGTGCDAATSQSLCLLRMLQRLRLLQTAHNTVDDISVLFFSHPRSEGRPHHRRTFSIHLCPLSFWLTLLRGVQFTSWCCPSRPCVVFLACVHLALFLALSLSPGNSLVSSWCDHSMLAS